MKQRTIRKLATLVPCPAAMAKKSSTEKFAITAADEEEVKAGDVVSGLYPQEESSSCR